ncbi:hypothetical protein lerEdw1_000621, partial [Lerista edwardsae]
SLTLVAWTCLVFKLLDRQIVAQGELDHMDKAVQFSMRKDLATRRYESHPLCTDLQSKILQCYQQNSQQTLSCSALASEYMKCVGHAKQGIPRSGN